MKNNKTSGERTLTKDQIEKLLGTITELKHKVLLKLAINTGIRRDDIVSIRVKDINFDTGEIHFFEKKKKRYWSVFVNNDMLNYIIMLLNTYRKKDFLFPSNYNNRNHISGRRAYDILQYYCKRIGVEQNIPFHTLRASFVKIAKDKGWTYEQLKRQTGDREETLKKHYATPSDGEMKEVAKRGIV